MDGLNRILLYISPLILLGFSLVYGQDAPILELKPTQSTRYEEEGKSFTHYCHVNKAYTPVGPIRWLKNTVTEIKNEPSGIITVIPRPGSSGLMFRKVRRTDEGTYTCAVKIEGREEEARAQFMLKVFVGISFANVVRNQSADTGLDYTIKCDASADPKPQISWNRNGDAITDSPATNGKYRLTDDGLQVLKVEKTDGGAYECEAEQSTDWTSRSEQIIINLIVNYPPEFPEKEPAKVYAFIGGEVTMRCSADGQPRPTYEWFYKEDGNVVDQPGYVNYDPPNEASYSVLIKNMTDKSVFREYICRAKNSQPQGVVERTFVIHEVDKPSAPQLRSHRVRGNKIEIDLIPPKVEPPMNITGFRAMLKPEYTGWENATVIDFNMGKLHYIEALKHGTNYDIKFAARNEIGLGEFSEVQQVKTHDNSGGAATSAVYGNFVVFVSLLLAVLLI